MKVVGEITMGEGVPANTNPIAGVIVCGLQVVEGELVLTIGMDAYQYQLNCESYGDQNHLTISSSSRMAKP